MEAYEQRQKFKMLGVVGRGPGSQLPAASPALPFARCVWSSPLMQQGQGFADSETERNVGRGVEVLVMLRWQLCPEGTESYMSLGFSWGNREQE